MQGTLVPDQIQIVPNNQLIIGQCSLHCASGSHADGKIPPPPPSLAQAKLDILMSED
jgi:hypothetical protein